MNPTGLSEATTAASAAWLHRPRERRIMLRKEAFFYVNNATNHRNEYEKCDIITFHDTARLKLT